MPATAKCGRYTSSVQFIRKRSLGNEASRHKLPNGRGQSRAREFAARLFFKAPRHPAPAGRSFLTYLLHWDIMAGP